MAVEVAATKFFHGADRDRSHPDPHRDHALHSPSVRLVGRTAAGAKGVPLLGPHREERVIVPVPGINRAVVQAINVGRSVAPDVLAVLVSDDPDSAARIREEWEVQLPDVPLVIVESPYRALVGPLIAYLDVLDETWPADREADHLRGDPRVRGTPLVGADPLQPVG